MKEVKKEQEFSFRKLFNFEVLIITMVLLGAILLFKPIFTGMTIIEGNAVENGSLFSLSLLLGGVILFLMKQHGKI